MKPKKYVFTLWLLASLVILSSLLSSCTEGGKKNRMLKNVTDTLRASYASEISFCISYDESIIEGIARLSRDLTVTRLDILSPEPYCGLSVEYDISGAPSSIMVHFAGIDTTIPRQALSKLNVLSYVSSDDFLSVLRNAQKGNITEYEKEPGISGYCVKTIFGEATTEFCFSAESGTPYSFKYKDEKLSAELIFTKFKSDILFDE